MKYIKLFNEGFKENKLEEIIENIKYALIELEDLNLSRKGDFLYKIESYSDSTSMKMATKWWRLDIKFTKAFSYRGDSFGTSFTFNDFKELNTVFDSLVALMQEDSKKIDFKILWKDDEDRSYTKILDYNKMVEYLSITSNKERYDVYTDIKELILIFEFKDGL